VLVAGVDEEGSLEYAVKMLLRGFTITATLAVGLL